MSLTAFEKNITSQFGEDGVIGEIFNRIGTRNKICVEFGAWDGKYLSNVWNLWHNNEWHAVLIESDANKFGELTQNAKGFDKVSALNRTVTFSGADSLDNILDELNIEKDPDLVCIDVDGNDYFIFENLIDYRPRLLIVEYNPTIPPHMELVQQTNEYLGSSALALYNLAHRKGYKFVHLTDSNMFFVPDNEFEKFGFKEPGLSDIFKYEYLNYVFSNYSGNLYLTGKLCYGGLSAKEKRLIKFGNYSINRMNPASGKHSLVRSASAEVNNVTVTKI